MAELRELDLAAGEREQLGVQVAALREKLTDQRAERGQVEHLRQVRGGGSDGPCPSEIDPSW